MRAYIDRTSNSYYIIDSDGVVLHNGSETTAADCKHAIETYVREAGGASLDVKYYTRWTSVKHDDYTAWFDS